MTEKQITSNDPFAELDELARSAPISPQGRSFWTWLLTGFDWHPGVGPDAGIWERNPSGHRCLWSCVWSCEDGLIDPNIYRPIETLTVTQLLAEANDILHRNPLQINGELARLVLDFYFGFPMEPVYFRSRLAEMVRQSRVGYETFSHPVSRHPQEFFRQLRPGFQTVRQPQTEGV